MKKLFVLFLILAMATSVVSGTLAMYTTSIDDLAEGSAVAKEFVFTGGGTDSFGQGVKIAPSEQVAWQFNIKNFDGGTVTETDLYYKLTFHVQATPGKQAIEPLQVSVKDSSGNVLGSITGTGTFDVTGSFPLAAAGQQRDFTVEIDWPEDGDNDIDYAGGGFGTSISIDAIASQLPLEGGGTTPEPGGSDITVLYETTPAWANGGSENYQYNYKVTITNNTDQTIEDWTLAFSLTEDRITNAWSNAKLISKSGDTYSFENPAYNNVSFDNILPGQSVSFGGSAKGHGDHEIFGASVGGSNMSPANASVICDLNKEITY